MPARLAQHLVARGLLSAQTIEDAQRRRASFGGTLDTVLLEMGAIAEPGMLQALADVSGLKPVNLADFEPNDEMARYVPANVAERLGAVPLSVDGDTLHVATSYPPNQRELEEVALLLGKRLEPWVAIEARIRDWIAVVYGTALTPRHQLLIQALDPTRPPPAPVPLTAPTKAAPPASTEPKPVAVEESTLEDALTRDMVEQIARAVAEEPILLEVRKKPKAPKLEPVRTDDDEPTIQEERTQRVDVRELQRSAAAQKTDAVREETRPIDLNQYAHLLKPELQETKTFDLSRMAAQMGAPEPGAKQPATWDRDATVPIDLRKVQQLARESARIADAPAPGAVPTEPGRVPSIAPVAPVAPVPAPPSAAAQQPSSAAQPPSAAKPASASQPPFAAPSPSAAQASADAQASSAAQPPSAAAGHRAESPAIGSPVPPAPAELPPDPVSDSAQHPAPWTIASPAEAAPPSAPQPITPSGFPGVIVFPNPNAKPAAPAGARQAPTPIAPSETAGAGVEWTLAEAREALRASTQDRDQIIRTALTFARRAFDFVAAFAIVRGAATGWAAEGDGAEAFQQNRPTIPLDTASVFRTVAMTRGSYVGPVPPDAFTAHYLQQLGRAPRTLFLFPVEVKDRLICLIYGDPGAKPISQRKLSDLLLLCQDLPGAFGELILFRKQRFGATQKSALSFDEVAPEPASTNLGWGPSTAPAQAGIGRAAGAPMVIEEFGTTPPDFAPILKKLTGPDATARAAAMAELARSPDASAKILVDHFPGPTAWSRLPVQELPDADELGPIPAALSRLGRSGAQALTPLLDADDPDVRYFALLTAGNLPFSELVGGVLRGIFDFEPDISSAARAAAAALRRVPRFLEAMKDLRQELADTDTLRRSLAARALGVLHDREAIEGLINLTGSDDGLCAQAAAEALREITRANFGPEPRSWTAWWAENRSRSRGEWLVAALRHDDLEVRLSAIEELSKTINDNYGYFADATPRDREGAIKKWEAALTHNPRLRRLE